jgi:3-hydroxy acid dehydrogenase/malonic semialdehyde reductase
MKRALITGASSGIGMQCAEKLAQQGSALILLARREERLQEIAERLRQSFKVEVLTASVDVSQAGQIEEFVRQQREVLRDTDILINSAGLARGTDKMQDAKLADWDEMLDTNIKGLLHITRAGVSGRRHLLCDQIRGPCTFRRFAHGFNGNTIARFKYRAGNGGNGIFCGARG